MSNAGKEMVDDDTGETVLVPPEEVHPHVLVFGGFVELDEGVWVRAAAVTSVLEMEPYQTAAPVKTFLCNVVTNDLGDAGSHLSVYPARTVLSALNLALEDGRRRRVERADF